MLNLPRGLLERAAKWASRVALVVGVAYVCASSLSSYLASTMLNSALTVFNKMSAGKAAVAQANYTPSTNYFPITKAIKDRNLFNSAGEFPEEANPKEQGVAAKAGSFDMNAPCTKPTINADLVGTIYMEGGVSLATIQEQGYSEADIYREGDLVIGNEEAAIVRIERNRVVLNNKGKKECLELAVAAKKKDDGFGTPNPGVQNQPGGGGGGGDTANLVQFEEKYVQDELGPGFGTIIQKARLVPNTTDNVMNGFKIFAIDGGSLLGKSGLQNGDIITQVNDVSLKQPEQGFALYQALQDEKEVRINILRKGTTPMTLVIRIK